MNKTKEAVLGPGDNEIQCLHCGQILRLLVPVPLGVVADTMKAFSALHEHCHAHQVFDDVTTIDDVVSAFWSLCDRAANANDGVLALDMFTTLHDELITIAANYASDELYTEMDESISQEKRS